MKKHKGGRYSDRNAEKRKKHKRDVISYEDVPLEEYNDERTEISKPAVKRILIGLAVILAMGLVVFAVANRDNLTPEKIGNWFKYEVMGSHDNGYPAKIIGTNVTKGNFEYNGDVCYVSDTTFESLSRSGNEIGYSQHSFSKPVLRTSGDNVLIFNLGGNGYVTGNKKQLNKTRECEQYIIDADINAKGYYAVVTQADGYLSKLFVYNNNDEKIYTYSFSEYYICSVALNETGTGCVACGVSGDGGSLAGIAYVLDFEQEEPVATYTLEENMVYESRYLTNNTVCIIGSNASFTLNIRDAAIKTVEYSHNELTAYDIDPDTDCFVLSLSRSGDGRKCTLEYINRDGEPVSTNETERAVTSVSLYKNRIAVLDSTKCYVYDTEGKRLGKADAGIGAKAIRLEDVSSAYLLGINEIRRAEFE